MSVDPELDRLQVLGLEGLRQVWAAHYGAPPRLRSPELLRLMLGWRMQAEVQGGLEPDLRRQLRRDASELKGPVARPGTRLAREWKGVRHEVVMLSDGGVLYGEASYASLSEVARAITGSRWNGPRFFGLRSKAGA